MEIVFVRHGEPTYEYVEEKGFLGHGLDLSQLTENGKRQAEEAARDSRLDGIELIVSSPYTRALQTAVAISRYRDVGIEIELDLHEWLPDMTFAYGGGEFSKRASELCAANKGVCPADSVIRYEELSSVFLRACGCLKKYLGCTKIAAVTHGVVIRQFAYAKDMPFCGISAVSFSDGFPWHGFIE